MQKNRIFKKYHLFGKFIFQLVMMNFTDFRRNISVLMQKKKLKTLPIEQIHILT